MVQTIVLICHKLADKAGTTIQAIKLAKLLASKDNRVVLIGEGSIRISNVQVISVKPSNIPLIFALRVKQVMNELDIGVIDIVQGFDPLYSGWAVQLIKASKKVLRIGAVYEEFYPTRLVNTLNVAHNGNLRKLFRLVFIVYILIIFSGFNLIYANCNFLAKHYTHLSRTFVHTIPNILDEDTEIKDTSRSDLLRVLFVGRIEPRKNVEDIFYALDNQTIKSMIQTVTLIGSDQKTPDYAKAVIELGQNILEDKLNHMGFVEPDQLPNIYKSHDIALFPTNDKYFPITEGMPNVVVEALSYGLPIIATDVAGVPEILREQLRILLISKNSVVKGLQDKILEISKLTQSEYQNLCTLCYNRVKKYNRSRIYQKYHKTVLQ